MSDSKRVLLVDDDKDLLEIISMELELASFTTYLASTMEEALAAVKEYAPKIVLMDMHLGGPAGNLVAEALLKIDSGIRIIAFTGYADTESVINMLRAGAQGYLLKDSHPEKLPDLLDKALSGEIIIDPDLQKTLWNATVEALQYEHKAAEDAKAAKEEVENLYDESILSLVEALRTRDHETQGHVDRVCAVTKALAVEMGLSPTQVENAYHGALFHDIGKLGVPDRILFSNGQLTDEGWKIIKDHTIIGQKILKPIRKLSYVADVVRATHENWNGSGYPDRSKGEDIPLEARLIRVADTFDAMTSGRRYQENKTITQAVEAILELSGEHFDPSVVKALKSLDRQKLLSAKKP